MSFSVRWLPIAMALFARPADSQKHALIEDLNGLRIRHRVAISQPTAGEFERNARAFLGGQIRLGSYVVFGSPQEGLLSMWCGDHGGYNHWRSVVDLAKDHGLMCPETQEAMRVGDEIVIRRSGSSCHPSVETLDGGANPLLVEIDGAKFAIQSIAFFRIGRASQGLIGVEVFATTATPNQVAARKLLAHFTRIVQAPVVSVTLRSDPFFIDSCRFPAVFPFRRDQLISADTYLGTNTYSCSTSSGGRVGCSTMVGQK